MALIKVPSKYWICISLRLNLVLSFCMFDANKKTSTNWKGCACPEGRCACVCPTECPSYWRLSVAGELWRDPRSSASPHRSKLAAIQFFSKPPHRPEIWGSRNTERVFWWKGNRTQLHRTLKKQVQELSNIQINSGYKVTTICLFKKNHVMFHSSIDTTHY